MTDTSHFETCRQSLKRLRFTTKWRFIITAFSIVINTLMYFAHMYTSATIAWSGQNTFLSFLFLIASLVLGAFILYLSGTAAAYPEKIKPLCLLMGLLILARLTNILLNVFSFLLLLWATQFLQIKKAKWLTEQEGYPYFSERFEEQKENTGYVPFYQTASPEPQSAESSTAEMPGIPEMPDIPEIPEIPE